MWIGVGIGFLLTVAIISILSYFLSDARGSDDNDTGNDTVSGESRRDLGWLCGVPHRSRFWMFRSSATVVDDIRTQAGGNVPESVEQLSPRETAIGGRSAWAFRRRVR